MFGPNLGLKIFLEVSALRDVRCSACSAWYPNLTKKLKHRIKTTQNKCMLFCLQLDQLKLIFHEEFERLNLLPVPYRFKQCVNTIVFKGTLMQI